jgi:DNA-binding GntR family transcriptional regulator
MTSAEVADWLRERIRSGELRPGQRLVEADLVVRLGSSRMRVREALRRLEAESFVEVHEHRATFVKTFARDDVINFHRAREVLEALAARLVAERPLPENLRTDLVAVRDNMDAAVASNDRDAYFVLNERFHDLVLRHCGNEYVVSAVERLRAPHVRLQLSNVLGTMVEQQHADHHRIIAALLAGNAVEAEQAMRDHISNGGRAIARIDERHFHGDAGPVRASD